MEKQRVYGSRGGRGQGFFNLALWSYFLIGRLTPRRSPSRPQTTRSNKTAHDKETPAGWPHLCSVAKNYRDYLRPICFGSFCSQIMGAKGANFDGKKFEFIGAPSIDNPVCVLTKASGITSMEQWFAAKQPVRLDGVGPGGTASHVARAVQAALKLPIRVVEPYKGTAELVQNLYKMDPSTLARLKEVLLPK